MNLNNFFTEWAFKVVLKSQLAQTPNQDIKEVIKIQREVLDEFEVGKLDQDQLLTRLLQILVEQKEEEEAEVAESAASVLRGE